MENVFRLLEFPPLKTENPSTHSYIYLGCARLIGRTRVRKWTPCARSYMQSPNYMGHFPINPWRLVIHYGIHCGLDTSSACLGH